MKLALTTYKGLSPEASRQIEKEAAAILYEFRNTPVAIAAAALLEKLTEYCGYWMPWITVAVDRITPENTIHLTVRRRT